MRRLLLRSLLGSVAGGLPPRRPDQVTPASSAGVTPGTASGTVRARLVIVFGTGPNTGLFVYSGTPKKGSLIAQIVAPGVTSDPYGNTVSSALNIGSWSAAGALLQHFGVDQNGQVFIVGPDGVTRVRIDNGFGGTGPDIRFFNDFGAVILVVDPSRGGTFQYQDNNSAVQGVLIGAQVGKNTTDPVNGTAVNAGINLIDPAFGDTLTAVGANINLIQVLFTLNALVTANTGAGATSPFLHLAGPEQGHAGHAVVRVYGVSADGTVPAGVIITVTDPPVRAAAALLEVQGSQALKGIATPAAPPAGNALLFADTAGFLRMLTGLAGDTNVYETAYQEAGASNPGQVIGVGATTITGCTFPVGSGIKYAFKARITFSGAFAAGTANFSVSGPTNTGPWIDAMFIMSSGTAGVGAQNAALGPVNSPTLTTGNNVAAIEGELTTTAAGTLALQCAAGTLGDNVIIQQAHFWLYRVG